MLIHLPLDQPARASIPADRLIDVVENKTDNISLVKPIKIAILNLMPKKEETELDLLLLLANSPLVIEVTWLHMASHQSKNTSQAHLDAFYQTTDELNDQHFDGLIITGAPLEQMPFEEVRYWHALQAVFDWSQTNVHSTLFVCWAAQAALYHFFGIQKYDLKAKMFGVFPHEQQQADSLFGGMNRLFYMPHSRHSEIRVADCVGKEGLDVLALSDEAGVGVLRAQVCNQVYFIGHAEYPAMRLHEEYLRDVSKGLTIVPPVGYYRQDDPQQEVIFQWESDAQNLYGNWLQHDVVQFQNEKKKSQYDEEN